MYVLNSKTFSPSAQRVNERAEVEFFVAGRLARTAKVVRGCVYGCVEEASR